MSRGIFGTRTLATILIASFCLVSTSSSAQAGWGHHRHFHHRFHVGWPRYASYASYGCYGNYSYASYRVSYPVYQRIYIPSYYPAPYVGYGCYGYGYRPWFGFGGYYLANSVDRLPNAERTIMSPVANPAIQVANPAMQVATSDQRARVGNIEFKVNVPEDARVTINDRPTSVEGSERVFVIRGGLLEGQYPFVVRAEIERNGQTITETRQVDLRGGQISSLTFDLDAKATQIANVEEPVNTTVRLRVPEAAKVYLAGYEMKQKGEIRVFETSKLRAGEELDNYTVRVIMGDGKLESREKRLTLVGGQTQEVEFDFASPQRLVAR